MKSCDFCRKSEKECKCFDCNICGDADSLITPLYNTACRCSIRNPPDSKASELAAERLKAKGIPACFVCGRPLAVCDKEAKELGHDECEEWAEH